MATNYFEVFEQIPFVIVAVVDAVVVAGVVVVVYVGNVVELFAESGPVGSGMMIWSNVSECPLEH